MSIKLHINIGTSLRFNSIIGCNVSCKTKRTGLANKIQLQRGFFFLSLSEEKRREKRKTTNLYDFLRMRQNGSAARLDLHLLLEVLRQI